VEHCATYTDQNAGGGPNSHIANTKISGGFKTTMCAALALSEEWSYATCTPSTPEPWQVGGDCGNGELLRVRQ